MKYGEFIISCDIFYLDDKVKILKVQFRDENFIDLKANKWW